MYVLSVKLSLLCAGKEKVIVLVDDLEDTSDGEETDSKIPAKNRNFCPGSLSIQQK